jgi:hypothetical protein
VIQSSGLTSTLLLFLAVSPKWFDPYGLSMCAACQTLRCASAFSSRSRKKWFFDDQPGYQNAEKAASGSRQQGRQAAWRRRAS